MANTPSTTDSILKSVRKYCNVDAEYDIFDDQLIPLINSYLDTIKQIGIGDETFEITGESETWADFLGTNEKCLHFVPTFIKIKVRIAFDPPSNSFVTTALNEQADEMLWRANVQVDPKLMSPNEQGGNT